MTVDWVIVPFWILFGCSLVLRNSSNSIYNGSLLRRSMTFVEVLSCKFHCTFLPEEGGSEQSYAKFFFFLFWKKDWRLIWIQDDFDQLFIENTKQTKCIPFIIRSFTFVYSLKKKSLDYKWALMDSVHFFFSFPKSNI